MHVASDFALIVPRRRAVSSGFITIRHQVDGAAIDVLENFLDGELLDADLGFARYHQAIAPHGGTTEIRFRSQAQTRPEPAGLSIGDILDYSGSLGRARDLESAGIQTNLVETVKPTAPVREPVRRSSAFCSR